MTTVITVRGRDRAALLTDPNFCYVGRACAGWPASDWGNPFKVGMTRWDAFEILRRAGMFVVYLKDVDRKLSRCEAVSYYCGYLEYRPDLRRRAAELRGKVLGCWCCDYDGVSDPMPPCHAAVLARLANGLGAPIAAAPPRRSAGVEGDRDYAKLMRELEGKP